MKIICYPVLPAFGGMPQEESSINPYNLSKLFHPEVKEIISENFIKICHQL